MARQELVGSDTFSTVTVASKVGANTFASYITTSEIGLVPVEPLTIQPFEEDYEVLQAASYHGPVLRYPDAEKHLYKLSSGSWKFYWQPDGRVHSFWDGRIYRGGNTVSEGRSSCWGHAVKDEMLSEANYPPWRLQRWTLSSQLPELIRQCGTEVCPWIGLGHGAKGGIQYYRGRVWVSGLAADDTGKVTVTLSYELQAPDDWGK